MLYILSWAFCLALLLAVYKVFLCGTTFHRFNRFLLLGFLALSAVLPLCHIETEHTGFSIAETEFVKTLETMYSRPEAVATSLQEEAITPKATGNIIDENIELQVATEGNTARANMQPSDKNRIDNVTETGHAPIWPYLLVGIYLMYVMIILCGWVRSTVRMKRFLRSCRRYRLGKWIRLAVHKNLFGPFNWMNYIVVPDEERKLHSDVAVCHEMAHVRCLHCIDLVVVGVCALVNPVAWLLLRELKALHEYEADDHVLRSGRLEAKTYQTLLIKKTVGAEAYALASCLNFNLKNRIIMMKKEQTNGWRKAWLLAVIPVAGVALAVFAKPASEADKSVDICLAPVETADIPLQPDASRAVNLYVEKDGDVYCSVGGHAFFKHEKQQIDIELDDVVGQGVMDAYENGKPTTVHITCEEGTDVEKYKSVHSQARTALTLAKSKVDNPEKIDERIAVHNNEYRALLGSSAVADNDTIYKVVENLPEFPGGTGELMTYLMKNLVYPQECNAVPGFGMRVIVRVVVEKDGSLSDITVLNHKDSNKETAENKAALDKAREAARNEAVRVVKSMPKWTPAKHKGKAVRCYFTMPVAFRTK